MALFQVAAFVDEAVKIAVKINKELGKHKIKDFKTAVQTNVSADWISLSYTNCLTMDDSTQVAVIDLFPLTGLPGDQGSEGSCGGVCDAVPHDWL